MGSIRTRQRSRRLLNAPHACTRARRRIHWGGSIDECQAMTGGRKTYCNPAIQIRTNVLDYFETIYSLAGAVVPVGQLARPWRDCCARAAPLPPGRSIARPGAHPDINSKRMKLSNESFNADTTCLSKKIERCFVIATISLYIEYSCRNSNSRTLSISKGPKPSHVRDNVIRNQTKAPFDSHQLARAVAGGWCDCDRTYLHSPYCSNNL